jgi:regulator of protease activity HflC (stomatin/prohibitin superfamily)
MNFMKNKMIGAVITAAILIVGAVALVACIEKIPTGYEGVVYSVSGGVEKETLSQGWHLVSPFKQVKEFTIGNEQLLLTEDRAESFKVATSDDASIAISFQMSYRFYSEDLVKTYSKFKGMDGEDIVSNRVKTVLKSKVSEITSDFSMMDIYSGNRNEINTKITEYLQKDFKDKFGIEVVDASIIDVHPDEKLKQAIDNRVTALQEKQQAQAEQEKVKVEAETARIKAENEAKIKILEAEAEAKANKLKSQSITKELIDMTEAEARLKHGWVTVQGADSIVTTNK